jgi:gamma-glutamylcyclotransferase (GGCT)/AIG2-like uncharacterized protein YtfP
MGGGDENRRRTPGQDLHSTGALKRSLPTGGCANGTPLNTLMWPSEAPCNRPSGVAISTCADSARLIEIPAAAISDCSHERRLRKCTEGGCITTNTLLVNRLFVYGTLRLGAMNEHAVWLAAHTRHMGAARIPGQLFRVSHYPALGPPVRKEDWVKGDLFEGLTAAMLQRLDDYEGAEYARRLSEITMDDGRTLAAYIYCWALSTDGLESIASGDWFSLGPCAPE